MYALYGENTQRNARVAPKRQDDDVVVTNIVELRKRRRAEQRAAQARAREEARVKLEEQRAQANAAIRRANQALAALRQRDPSYWNSANRKHVSSINVVVSRICRATGVTRAEIMSPKRAKNVAFARQAIFYWTYRRTLMSLPEIGKALGGFDHTTILHALKVYPEKRAMQGRTLRDARSARASAV